MILSTMAIEEKNEARSEIKQMQDLLREWRRWKASWWPQNGFPSAVPYVDSMRGSRPMDGYDDPDGDDARIRAVEMRAVDRLVDSLSSPHKAAIGVVYLNEIGPSVWRSNRLPHNQVKRIAAEAERLMLPGFRREGLIR